MVQIRQPFTAVFSTHGKMERAKEIADVLGLINESNMGSIAKERDMRNVIEEYFLAPPDDGDNEYTDIESSDDESDDNNDSGIGSKLTEMTDQQQPMEMDTTESDDEDTVPAVVLVQPVTDTGESDIPVEHQRDIAAHHRHEQVAPDQVDLELEQAQDYKCTCTYQKGGPCYKRYSPAELVDCRDRMNELTNGKFFPSISSTSSHQCTVHVRRVYHIVAYLQVGVYHIVAYHDRNFI